MNCVFNVEFGLPDAKDAKVARRTLKNTKIKSTINFMPDITLNSKSIFILFLNFFGFLLRPSRNLSALRVRKFSPSSLSAASTL